MTEPTTQSDYGRYQTRLHRTLLSYVLGVVLFLLLLIWAEQQGLPRSWIGPIFLLMTIAVYAAIGISSRTTDPDEYYVAGRRIPAIYNGMAAAADWMSAASFISLAGGLYLQGFSGTEAQPGGLAYILGWTGGFCLVGLLIAPLLRQSGVYTVPEYFELRYGGRWPRRIAAVSAVVCSFVYLVAQIYGVGLVASRLSGVQFEIGIMLGLGGVLLCSFLGGMRAITWTQVAQYVVLLLAFLIPVSWLAYKQLGNPLAPLVYGQQVQKITALEIQLNQSPSELEVRAEFLRRARAYELKLRDVDAALIEERRLLKHKLTQLKTLNADVAQIVAVSRELSALPKEASVARERWTLARNDNLERAKPLGGMPPHEQAFAGDPDGTAAQRAEFHTSRLNFLALMFCLMVGTAGLPHLLTRYCTTPTVAAARTSVAWSLFFIALLYLSAPALAVLVKFEVMSHLVGIRIENLPAWIDQWSRVDATLVSVADVNGDGILQFGEIRFGADIIMLATPELGGLPYVISGLVAAGGLAAALSTADALLLTISSALARDIYLREGGSKGRRDQLVMVSKFVLLAVALVAAFVASLRPAGILQLVSASFSLAAAAFVPAMLCGFYWRRVTGSAAVAGMLAGLGATVYYMAVNFPAARTFLGLTGDAPLWFGILPISAGVFGMPMGLLVIVVCTLVWRPCRTARSASEPAGEKTF